MYLSIKMIYHIEFVLFAGIKLHLLINIVLKDEQKQEGFISSFFVRGMVVLFNQKYAQSFGLLNVNYGYKHGDATGFH